MNSTEAARAQADVSHDRLLRIIERAATADERREGRIFVPSGRQNAAARDKSIQQWVDAIAGGDARVFAGYLRRLDLSRSDFERGFAAVSLRDPDVVPEWALPLLEVWNDLDRHGPVPYDVLGPFLALAARDLRRLVTDSAAPVDHAGQSGMLDVLRARLRRIMLPMLAYERESARVAAALMGQGSSSETGQDWRDRLESFPVLAWVIGTAYRAWLGFVTDICDRLSADAALLQKRSE